MKIRILSCIALSVITFISFISVAGAAEVPWILQSYEAFAIAGEDLLNPACPDDICEVAQSFGPPLPISASTYYGFPGFEVSVDSTITASTMSLQWDRSGYDYRYLRARAKAYFIGNYTSEYSHFNFSYNGSGVLTVNDVSTSTTLFSGGLPGDSGVYYIPTTVGNEIEVILSMDTGEIAGMGNQSGTQSLSYNMSVAPEPISSILFITGGTLLAGRSFLKRKKV